MLPSQEFCDRGSLKEAITQGAFLLWGGDTAAAAAAGGSRQHSPAAGGAAGAGAGAVLPPHLQALQLGQFSSSSGGLVAGAAAGGGIRGGPHSLVPFNMKVSGRG